MVYYSNALAIVCLGLLQGLVLSECPNGWVTFESSCYLFDHSLLHFTEAQAVCKKYGAHLVHIETQVEDLFLQSFIADEKDGRYWIGLTDHVIEGIWRWTDTNLAGSYSGWFRGQPDGLKGANCAAIHSSYKYQWVDVPCNTAYNAVCEKRNNRTIDIGEVVVG